MKFQAQSLLLFNENYLACGLEHLQATVSEFKKEVVYPATGSKYVWDTNHCKQDFDFLGETDRYGH
jgi:hypothetical protein